MIIGSRQRLSRIEIDPSVLIDDQNINRVTSTKTSGVFIDEKITWRTHVDHVSKKFQKE